MPGMAHYWATMQETRQHDSLSLKDGLQLLIQAELDNRTTSRNSRLVKKARFRYQTSISEVIYDSNRGVDKQKVLNLATCDYVRKGVSVLITGAARSEEHTSELQSRQYLVCRLLLEKKKQKETKIH